MLYNIYYIISYINISYTKKSLPYLILNIGEDIKAKSTFSPGLWILQKPFMATLGHEAQTTNLTLQY